MGQSRVRMILLMLLVTAVFAATTQSVSPQEAPPRPYRSIEEIPHWTGTRVTTSDQPQDAHMNAAPAYIYDWSSRVWQYYQSGNWDIMRKAYNDPTEVIIGAHGASDIQPRLNRGATHVAFASNRHGAYEIYRMTIDGADLTRLTATGSNNVNPAWSFDGSKIAFQSYRDDQAEVYIMNTDGSGQTRLTYNQGFDGMPTWSPDGSKIAFSSYRDGAYRIYVMNADGSDVTPLSAQLYSMNPTWSPDGAMIAYDADLDGDGWQELWLMDADGSNQRLLYDPPGQTDAWARSWSPDGRMINYTLINFTYYQGNWYWIDAYLDAYYLPQNNTERLSHSGRDWNMDVQTADLIPPTSTINPLPAQSIHQFSLNWSGQDVGPAGIEGYDLRYKMGADGAWVILFDNIASTGYEYRDAIGGQTYYFQVRARDWAGNVEAWDDNKIVATTIENQPPQTTVAAIQPFTRSNHPLTLDWTGFDPGGSGVAEYELQYRIDQGSWVDWTTVTGGPITFENPIAGKTYYFQVRGVDRAQNRESWVGGNGDVSTTVYATSISGVVQDNSGTPIQGITLTTSPNAFQTVNGDENGRYASYLATNPPTYTAHWAKNGYGALPSVTLPGTTDVQFPIVLPPDDNVVGNSGFETGDFAPEWLPGGSALPFITTTLQHTGAYAALLSQGGETFTNGSFLGFSSSELRMVTDSNQTIHAAWINSNQLIYNQRVAGNWLPSQIIPADITSNVLALQLAVDDLQTVHFTWQTTDGVYYIRKPNGGSWSTLQVVSEIGAYYGELQMGVSGDGIVHIIWQHEENINDLFYRRRAVNGTWSPVQNISNVGFNTSVMQQAMALDNMGGVHIVWHSYRSSSSEIFYTHLPVGGSWSTPQNISQQPGSNSSYPSLIVDTGGIAHVVWDYSGDFSLYYARRSLNGAWSAPYKFTDEVHYLLSNLFLDDNGNLYVIFGTEYQPYVIKRNVNGIWSDPLSLRFTGQNLQATIDSSGLAHVVYQDQDSYEAYYVQQTRSGDWTAPKQLAHSPQTSTFFSMQMLIDEFGHAHMLWRNAYSDTYYAGPTWAATTDTLTLTQQITIPLTMSTPTLSFLYQAGAIQCGSISCLALTLDDGFTPTQLWSMTESKLSWNHEAVDLSPWAGQTVSLTFRLDQVANAPLAWAYLDEVTVGAAHPDVWVKAGGGNGLPNEQVVHTLTYGNRGGAIAPGARLTYTLPAGLSFVSANLPPISTTPLVWELGHLAAKGDPFVLTMVLQVASTAVPLSTLSSTAVIHPGSNELETLNNSAQGLTFVGKLTYLPIISK
ncbi:MAG: PD40 domain-containing protein [Anaerolinea sp.]|nr:PD40 domain-containing protein [Anaerolinea sp.]